MGESAERGASERVHEREAKEKREIKGVATYSMFCGVLKVEGREGGRMGASEKVVFNERNG